MGKKLFTILHWHFFAYVKWLTAALRAWSRSSIISSSSSIPTDRRIRLSEIPRCSLSWAGTEAWVITDLKLERQIFVWFDSLRPINNLSVIKGRVFLGWTSTKLELMFLLKDTTQCRRWGSYPQPLGLESSPTDRRIRLSEIPRCTLSWAGTEAWVITILKLEGQTGSEVECLTCNQGVAISSLMVGTVLYPWTNHCFVLCQPRKTSWHDWNIVDWDTKHQLENKIKKIVIVTYMQLCEKICLPEG